MLASQAVIGIPSQYPGGDPLLILVPPAEQFRRDYVFLTPDTYAFNFVEIVAPDRAQILLDGAQLDMSVCARSNIPDLASDSSGAAPHWVEPVLVVDVEHLGRTSNGLLRQPTIVRMRPDLSPDDVGKGAGS